MYNYSIINVVVFSVKGNERLGYLLRSRLILSIALGTISILFISLLKLLRKLTLHETWSLLET